MIQQKITPVEPMIYESSAVSDALGYICVGSALLFLAVLIFKLVFIKEQSEREPHSSPSEED